jgi:hypothetical protein
MGQLAVPMMIGAAVGGGTKLLQGKGLGSILKGAALGGAMGGATGGLMNAAGGIGGAAGGVTSSQGAQGLLGATGAAGTGASLAVPTIAEGAVAGNMLPAFEAPIGMFNNASMLTGEQLATSPLLTSTAASTAPSMFTNAVGAGGLSALNSGVAAPATFDTMFGSLKDLATLDNLKGAKMVADKFQPQPMQQAPSGTIKVGQAPTGDIYDELRKYGYTLPKRRETNFSLIG